MKERFETGFTKTDGCWVWQKSLTKKGYGRFWNGTKAVKAHRASYELYVGKIPPTLFVCHKCDNPKCVRPDHLFLGTNRDNMIDMIQKGRNINKGGAPIGNQNARKHKSINDKSTSGDGE